MRKWIPFLISPLLLAQSPDVAALLKQAARGGPELRQALGDDKVKKGTAWAGHLDQFVFAVDAPSKPVLVIDDTPQRAMKKSKDGLWWSGAKLATGRTHNFHYMVGGKRFGGVENVPAFGPYSYEKPGVPKGKLDGKHVHKSTLYPGMESDYWIWTPAQYDPAVPAALMVWQDGQGMAPRELPTRSQIVFENLTHEKKIPVIVHVFVSPGLVGERRMRSIQYDTMDDKYPRFIRDEILAEVSKKYNIRSDSYSRAIAGNSSGGICAFNAAYTHPELFSRVLSRIGSFTSIQWQPGVLDGGNVYPFKIRKEPKKNIRVWLQDGSGDLENNHGSWPAQNIAMANSLKMKEYDFHLSWGNGSHSGNAGNSELPEEMIWLWRDYDPAKTSQDYMMDPAEKDKPFFRVAALNR